MNPLQETMEEYGRRAKAAAGVLARAGTREKNRMLRAAAGLLRAEQAAVLEANRRDLDAAAGLSPTLRERLTLNPARVEAMAQGLEQVAALPDPIGEGVLAKTLPNGLRLSQVRVPLGVLAIIYEARPNVTADAAGLCLKAGNAVILRGGKEAIHANTAIATLLRRAVGEAGGPEDALQLVTDTSRDSALALMGLAGFVDALIPRGGEGLLRTVKAHSKVPVIEDGAGNCHVYVDASAHLEKAQAIVLNAKTQRPSVCNACEKLLVHQRVAPVFIPRACGLLAEKGVALRGDKRAASLYPAMDPAGEEDWGKEYLDLILAVKVVDSLEEAIGHIGRYGTGHSEAIVTEDYGSAQRFTREVDAAAVYVNASTRFTDGYEFGFGAEIGISTQKLHARGPMGLRELTSTKYIVLGDGHVRES
jgi:glutamate-5-semialdehyde dehydrogenase